MLRTCGSKGHCRGAVASGSSGERSRLPLGRGESHEGPFCGRGDAGDSYSIPSRFWICSNGTPFVSGMTSSTHSNCRTIIAA